MTDQVPLLIEGTPVEAEVLMPVPPYCAAIAVAFQIPVVRVPTLVKEEERIPAPRVLSERTSVPFILKVDPEERLRVPLTSSLYEGEVVPIPTLPVPLGLMRTLPVVSYEEELPIVKVCRLVVARVPSPVR